MKNSTVPRADCYDITQPRSTFLSLADACHFSAISAISTCRWVSLVDDTYKKSQIRDVGGIMKTIPKCIG